MIGLRCLLYPPAADFSATLLKRLFATAAIAQRPVFAHTRSIGARLRHAVAELLALASQSKARLVIANFKVAGRGGHARWVAVQAMLDRAVAAGTDVWLTYYPYSVASTYMSFARPGLRNGLWSVLHDRTALLRIDVNTSVSLAQEAQANGETPLDSLQRWLVEDDGQTMAGYPILDEDVIDKQAAWQRALIVSDDEAMPLAEATTATHPRCFGSFARALRFSDTAGLPGSIARVTSLPADILGLADRGRIKRGAVADLAIFGAQGLRDRARYGDPQIAEGLNALIVNGVVALANGKLTGARPGRTI